jgi:hypothetical protein
MRPAKQPWDVLQEAEPWSYLANDARRIRPHVPFISGAELAAGDTEWLAREPPRDAIHASAPCSTVEGSHVIPDGGIVEHAVCDALLDDSLAVVVSLDVAHDSVPEQSMGVDSAACPCKQLDGT